MTCSCSAPSPSTATTERAIICTCMCRKRVAYSGCLVNGRPLIENVMRGECPAGRFPDTQGRVRWLGIMWWGIPAPIRWTSCTRLGREITGLPWKIAKLPGCGCAVRPLAVSTAVRRRVGNLFRHRPAQAAATRAR